MAINKTYITLTDLQTDKTVSTKLYIDEYSSTELEKAVDIKVSELIKAMPDVNLDLVPRPIYNTELSHSADLQIQVNILTADNDSLKTKVQALLADSSSLYTDNDGLRVSIAKLENSLASVQQTTLELRTNLTTSLTKAINEATERTSLEAENAGLVAQKTALIKQIDTLNNLLAQENATLQIAQQQLSAKQQAVAGGGVSTGELSTIVFDIGDITKLTTPAMIMQDYNGGPNGKANKFTKPGGDQGKAFAQYFDVVAGPKDISVEIKATGGFTILPYNFGVTLPITLKANETKRFTMDTPNTAWVNGYNGNDGGTFWRSSRPNSVDFTLSIIVKDIDPKGKTENKDFTAHIWKH
jgi:hypothetical protein